MQDEKNNKIFVRQTTLKRGVSQTPPTRIKTINRHVEHPRATSPHATAWDLLQISARGELDFTAMQEEIKKVIHNEVKEAIHDEIEEQVEEEEEKKLWKKVLGAVLSLTCIFLERCFCKKI